MKRSLSPGERPTPLHVHTPSIMLVDLREPASSWCTAAAPGITLLSVAHALAARERALVTLPLVIVIPDRDRDAVDLEDVAASIGAELLRFLAFSGRDYFVARIQEALRDAEVRRRGAS